MIDGASENNFGIQPEQLTTDEKVKSVQQAIAISASNPDYGLLAHFLAPENKTALQDQSVSQINEICAKYPDFTAWAYDQNILLDGAHYPFHDGRIHPYEIALFQSLLLKYFTQENKLLHGLPTQVIDDIVRSGLVHEVGLSKGRSGHEKEGARMVSEQYPKNPLVAYGVVATTVTLAELPTEESTHKVLVQKAVWEHKPAIETLQAVLNEYPSTNLSQEQLETLLAVMAYPDIKGLMVPSSTSQTGILASILENVLLNTSADRNLHPDEMRAVIKREINSTMMLTDGIQQSLEESPIYNRLLSQFKGAGRMDIYRNQQFFSTYFDSLQQSIPEAGFPVWFPYFTNLLHKYNQQEPSIQKSATNISQLHSVISHCITFTDLLSSSPDNHASVSQKYQEFGNIIAQQDLSFDEIETGFQKLLSDSLTSGSEVK